jgi:hypothetical protein
MNEVLQVSCDPTMPWHVLRKQVSIQELQKAPLEEMA